MPIYRQTYCHYDGKYNPTAIAWSVIASKGIQLIWRNKTFKFFRYPVLFVFLLYAGGVYIATNLDMFSFIDINLEDIREQLEVNFNFYFNFILTQTYICLIITLGVCPLLISNDIKHKAIGLYLSKALTRFDYLFGKGMSLFAYLFSILVLMPLFLLFLYANFSNDMSYLVDVNLIMKIFLFGMMISVSLVFINLAISSLFASSAAVNVTQICIYFLLPHVAGIIGWNVQGFSFFASEDSIVYFVSHYEWWSLLAPTTIWIHLGQVLFEQDLDYENIHWGFYAGMLVVMCMVCTLLLHIRIKPVEVVK